MVSGQALKAPFDVVLAVDVVACRCSMSLCDVIVVVDVIVDVVIFVVVRCQRCCRCRCSVSLFDVFVVVVDVDAVDVALVVDV